MDLRRLLEDPAARPVLADRARALALQDEIASGEIGAATLTFRLGGSTYSLPATAVREVQPLGSYTPLPAVPPFIRGLVNVRGRLITAIDLRPLIGLPADALPPGAMLLIICGEDSELGLVAESVVSVGRQTADLAPAPSASSGHSVAWVRGVDEELSLHLDPAALVAAPALVINAEASGQ